MSGLFIDGREVPAQAGETFASYAPESGQVLGLAARARAADVEAAVTAAGAAFARWSGCPPGQRERALLRCADALEAAEAELLDLLIEESGSTLTKARYEIRYGAELFCAAAGEARRLYGDTFPGDRAHRLFESAAYLVGQQMVYQPVLGEPIPPMPGKPRSWAIYQPFETKEGDLVFVGVTSDKHWQRFCEAFNRPDLLADPSLATNNQRYLAFERLTADLTAMFKTLSTAEVLAGCEKAEIPFAPVARPEDLLEDPHLLASGSLWEVEVGNGVRCNLPALPLMFSEADLKLRMHPPQVGEHTASILRSLGYSEAQICNLEA